VILIESMAQAGVVGLGLHLLSIELGSEDAKKYTTLFTDAQVEFSGIVEPGARVINTGRKVFFRRRKLRAEVEMKLEDGSVVCSGQLSGMGVPR
jgi:3-hydroxyacyl-[acyl-carrier-protein] dehydratase